MWGPLPSGRGLAGEAARVPVPVPFPRCGAQSVTGAGPGCGSRCCQARPFVPVTAGLAWGRVSTLRHVAGLCRLPPRSGCREAEGLGMLSGAASVRGQQCLHKAKDFSVSHASLPARRLGMHKSLGGDTTRTAVPNWSKEYAIAYGVILNNKAGGVGQWGCCCSGTGWTSVSRGLVSKQLVWC